MIANYYIIIWQELYDIGCRNIGFDGLPPLGCLLFQITLNLKLDRKCVAEHNLDADLFDKTLQDRAPQIKAMLPGCKIVYGDLYNPIMKLINEPQKYGKYVHELCSYIYV